MTSSAGGRADISDRFTLTSNISALATPVSQPSKKRERPSSFEHAGSDHHFARMPVRSDSTFDCAALSALMVMQDRKDAKH